MARVRVLWQRQHYMAFSVFYVLASTPVVIARSHRACVLLRIYDDAMAWRASQPAAFNAWRR